MDSIKRLPAQLRFRPVVEPARIGNRGSVLALALWSLCLLTTFAVYLGYGVRQKLLLAGQFDARNRLHLIAEAGVKKSILKLKECGNADFAALKEPWSNNQGAFKEIPVGRGRFTVSHSYLNRENSAGQLRYGIVDEESKININQAKRVVIERLFKAVGLDEMQAQNLSAAIVDWRDADSELSIPLGSAEDSYYRGLRAPYEAKDAPLEVPEELFLVRGMTNEIFDRIRDFITIYGEGQININTASAPVLSALGLDKSVVNKILSFRAGNDLLEATPDDNVFVLPANIVASLSQFYALSEAEVANLSNLVSAGHITTNSHNFMIKSVAELDSTAAALKIVCVFTRPADDPSAGGSAEEGKIRYWREKLE